LHWKGNEEKGGEIILLIKCLIFLWVIGGLHFDKPEHKIVF
jgi:hypothetical protein